MFVWIANISYNMFVCIANISSNQKERLVFWSKIVNHLSMESVDARGNQILRIKSLDRQACLSAKQVVLLNK